MKLNPAAAGSYQFEQLEGRHVEAAFLHERAALRLDGFLDLVGRHAPEHPQSILEVGCGQGIRTTLLAKHYPKARVIGIDRSKELLGAASDLSPCNLRFERADLYDLPFGDSTFDLVYARLVFMHLTHPLTALRQLQRVLKPGGRILLEDADRDCMLFEPAPSSFALFWQQVQDSQRRLGGDPNVGRRLAPYLKQCGFTDVRIEAQPIVGGKDEIEFLTRTLLPSLNLYLQEEDRPSGTRAINDLRFMAQNPAATFYHLWFVASGMKS